MVHGDATQCAGMEMVDINESRVDRSGSGGQERERERWTGAVAGVEAGVEAGAGMSDGYER